MTDHGLAAGSTTSASSHDSIEVSTPAGVAWDSTNFLSGVTFDLRHDATSNDTVLKLRATVVLKADAPSKTALFLHVQPECITSLVLEDVVDEEIAAQQVEARRRLGSDLACLRFTLTRPPDLIGPKQCVLTPKNKASGDVLDLLRSLAHQPHFAIYFSQKLVPKWRLALLCELASTRVLRTNARQADVSSLYRGKGGAVIVVPQIPSAATAQHDAVPPQGSPPSYNELDPSPPPAPLEPPKGEIYATPTNSVGLVS